MFDTNLIGWLLFQVIPGVGVYAVLAAWFRGDLFAGGRATFEAFRDSDSDVPFVGFRRFVGELMTCPFCLSYHVAFWLAVYTTAVGVQPWPMALFAWWAYQVVGYFLFRLSEMRPEPIE